MKVINKKNIFIMGFSIIIGLLIILAIYFYCYYLSVNDVQNIKIKGYVFEKDSGKPLDSVMVIINNDRYEDDAGNKNYDEYFGHDKIELYSDENGGFSIELEKSAFVWIEFSKKGYKNHIEDGKFTFDYIISKNINYVIYLEKININSNNHNLTPF